MKKVAWEWDQKYYEEKARSIKILHDSTIRVIEISSSTKPMPASKMEITVSNKGKEVVWGSERPECGFERSKISNLKGIQTSEDERSNSIETDDELMIQFSSVSRDFSLNMTFRLPATFKAKEGQSSIMCRDVEEKEIPTTVIIKVKDEIRPMPSPKLKSEKSTNKGMEKKTKIVGHSEYRSRVSILRLKKE